MVNASSPFQLREDRVMQLGSFLSDGGFRRHQLVRNRVGHFQLTAELEGEQVDILVDTGAASTVMDLDWCRKRGIALDDTGQMGGGAGGVNLAIYALRGAALRLDGQAVKSNGVYAVDLAHVNRGLAMKGAHPVHGVLGADVLTHHEAVIDYASESLFLKL
jgi:hypothetical protein